jgi:2-polyprenyl-6-methoxyphenol hydroxylase-like FAD-dependent oxidoreductase
MHKYDGELLGGPFVQKAGFDSIPTPVSRPKLISMLYDYVHMIGIPVAFGKRVIDYYEKLDEGKAGAITDEGEEIEGDLVIAADGVASKSWKAVSGKDSKAQSSGFSVYRVVYPTELALRNPLIASNFPLSEGGDDICRVWLGKNTHAIVLVSPENTTWFLTHKVSLDG